jgi:SAM-dependent methyltransferase
MSSYGPVTTCQVCGSSDLESVIFLAFLPPVNVMCPVDQAHDRENWFPAEMVRCPKCTLVQLGYTADPALVFPPEYPYTSGTTRILRENFADLYANVKPLMNLTSESLVIDIGSNDGTLLSNFHGGGHKVLGVEPSLTAKLAEEKGITTLMTFFGDEAANTVLSSHGKADVVTCANCFAHILDPNDVTQNIKKILKDNGIFVSESHYLLGLIETLQYDTIYHEHLRYYSLQSIMYLLEQNGFHVFKAQRIPTHGGSIRVYAQLGNRFPRDASVDEILAQEEKAGLNGTSWIKPFREGIVKSKVELYRLLADIRSNGPLVYGISAPSRASTLVNYVGLDDGLMPYVMEIKGSKKIGKFMPGRNIPVVEETKLYEDQPPFALLLSWHIASELMVNLKKRGYTGDFIIPLPEPHIVKNSEVMV